MARKNSTARGRVQVKQDARKQGAVRNAGERQHHQHRPAALNLGIYGDASLSNLLRVGQQVGADVTDLAAAAAELRNRNKRARNLHSRSNHV